MFVVWTVVVFTVAFAVAVVVAICASFHVNDPPGRHRPEEMSTEAVDPVDVHQRYFPEAYEARRTRS